MTPSLPPDPLTALDAPGRPRDLEPERILADDTVSDAQKREFLQSWRATLATDRDEPMLARVDAVLAKLQG